MAFTVPFGYTLRIEGMEDKYPGEMSGGTYGLRQVLDGMVEGWQLIPSETLRTIAPITVTQELYTICDAISDKGGEVLFAGGAVRDSILGYESKDLDVEIYGMDQESLVKELSRFGKVDQVGASFGVIKLTTAQGDYDFSLPRRENKTGRKHKEFDVTPDPDMTYEEAASRRDFTINSISMTTGGRIVDYFDGYQDLVSRVLKHTSDKFSEDPLRVLRGFQFAARFNMHMDARTAALCRGLRSTYKDIPRERVWTEWEKWATRGVRPSAGIQVLKDTAWIELYPELFNLVGVQQEPAWHPEGTVDIHTMHVVDAAAEIAKREELDPRETSILLFAALCHDMGKPSTTTYERGAIRAHGHAAEGVEPARKFLESIGAPSWLIENVLPLVREHMSHTSGEMNDRTVRRLANRVAPSNIYMLAHLIEADHSGRPPLPAGLPEEAKRMVDIARRVDVISEKAPPVANGKLLFALAEDGILPEAFLRPGKHFGTLLNYLYEAQLDGQFSTIDEARDFINLMFSPELKDTLEDVIDFIESLSTLRMNFLLSEANKMGITEKELVSLPMDKLKEMARLVRAK